MPSRPNTPLAAGLLVFAGLSAHADIPGDVRLEPAFGGHTFNFPLAVRHADDGSGRRFVVERGGRIRIVEGDDNVLTDPFLDISALTSTTSERGLLGLAFHPDFADNDLVYINHTASNVADVTTGDTMIVEYQVDNADENRLDPASRRVVMVIPQDFANHNGGDLHFGPDGYLWIGMGDGGSGNDPCKRAQTLDPSTSPETDCRSGEAAWLLGKMLRIDVDSTTPPGDNNLCAAAGDGSAGYAVPDDNPYVNDTDRCGEVWAYGFRNPYRFSFDRATGDVWIGDVGQSTWEEIDLESAANSGGDNYGWRVCEGSFERGTDDPCPIVQHDPVHEYARETPHCSVTGGYRYRGPIPSLKGRYVFGDYCSGQLWFAEEVGVDDWEVLEFESLGFGLVGFGEDEAGHLYLTRSDGGVLVFDSRIFADRFEQN